MSHGLTSSGRIYGSISSDMSHGSWSNLSRKVVMSLTLHVLQPENAGPIMPTSGGSHPSWRSCPMPMLQKGGSFLWDAMAVNGYNNKVVFNLQFIKQWVLSYHVFLSFCVLYQRSDFISFKMNSICIKGKTSQTQNIPVTPSATGTMPRYVTACESPTYQCPNSWAAKAYSSGRVNVVTAHFNLSSQSLPW